MTEILWFLMGGVLGAVVVRAAVRPAGVPQLLEMAAQVGRGEPVRTPEDLPGWAWPLARALQTAAEEVGQLRTRASRSGSDSHSVLRGADTTAEALAAGVGAQASGLEAATQPLVQMAEKLGQLEAGMEQLVKVEEESSSTIIQISTTNSEVVESVHNLATAVEEAAASIEEMTYSIREVARNIEDLSLAAEQTSASMNEMDTSISQVESNANATARLSEEVTHDAEKGSDAVIRTIDGIDKIKDSTRSAASVIKSLGGRIQEIGNILNVIDDVAEQTNLLALNAAIIAAQSGEHGRGFAVVADEIKDLAERTAASTKEIAQLIKNVQDESRNAVDSIQQGERNVEAGVALSREADGALRKILESAQKSTQMVKAIAQATVEQAKGSKVVADAVERIAKTVQQVAAATSEQARGSEQIMKSAERMKGITQAVERSSQEQARGSKQMSQAIESVHQLTSGLQKTAQEQQQVAKQALEATRRSREGLAGLLRTAEQLRTEVRSMRSQTEDSSPTSAPVSSRG